MSLNNVLIDVKFNGFTKKEICSLPCWIVLISEKKNMNKFHIQSFIKLVSSNMCNPVSVFRLFFSNIILLFQGKIITSLNTQQHSTGTVISVRGGNSFFKSIVFFLFFYGFFNFSRILLPHVHLSELKCYFAQFSYNNIAPPLLSKMIKSTVF